METKTPTRKEIPLDVMQEAVELARGTHLILPEGLSSLAEKIHEARLQNRKLRIKLGVDPTSKSLHLGHTVVLRLLRRFQRFGHEAFLLIGGFTAQIGDPTDRSSMRPVQTAQEVAANAESFVSQVSVIIKLDAEHVVNNADWLDERGMLSKLALLGRRVSMNKVMHRFKDRLQPDSPNPPSWTEGMYPLLQGFDSVHLKADVEIGGKDQLSNLLMVRELQQFEGQSPQVVLMVPLLRGLDGGKKMSKSEGTAISLSDSAQDVFGKCMSMVDDIKPVNEEEAATLPKFKGTLIVQFLELVTDASAEEVENERHFLTSGGNPKEAKERLAVRMVTELHGPQAAEAELQKWRHRFVDKQAPQDMPTVVLNAPADIVTIMVDAGLANGNDGRPSKSQARCLIDGGGVRIDAEKVSRTDRVITLEPGASCVLKVGKNFRRLVADNQPAG